MSIEIGQSVDWADIIALYNELREKQTAKGVTLTPLPTGSIGTNAFASQANDLRDAISGLNPTTSVPAAASVSSLITAEYMQALRSSLDSIPMATYLFQSGVGQNVPWTANRSHYVTAAGWAPDVWSTANINTERMYLKGTTAYVSETESHNVSATIKLTNAFSFANYTTLHIDLTAANSVRIRVLQGSSSKSTVTDNTKTRHTRTIDITSLNSTYTIEFYASGSSQGATIYNVYLT